MQIQTFKPRVASRANNTTEQTKPEQSQTKPLTERWTVDGASFSSTEALVDKLGPDFDKKAATYTYTTSAPEAPFQGSEKIKNAMGMGIYGAIGGAVGGAVVGGGLAFLSGVGSVLNGLMGGSMGSGAGTAILTVPIAIGATLGAGFAGHAGYNAQPESGERSVEGFLKVEGQEVSFYPGGRVDREVDLNAYKEATTPPLTKPTAEPQDKTKNTLKGAAVGAGLMVGAVVPVVGLGAGAVVGNQVGEAFGDKRTALAPALGTLAGVGVTAGIFGALSTWSQTGNWTVAAGLGLGLGVAGAAVGHKVFSDMANQAPSRNYGEQWWNQGSDNR